MSTYPEEVESSRQIGRARVPVRLLKATFPRMKCTDNGICRAGKVTIKGRCNGSATALIPVRTSLSAIGCLLPRRTKDVDKSRNPAIGPNPRGRFRPSCRLARFCTLAQAVLSYGCSFPRLRVMLPKRSEPTPNNREPGHVLAPRDSPRLARRHPGAGSHLALPVQGNRSTR